VKENDNGKLLIFFGGVLWEVEPVGDTVTLTGSDLDHLSSSRFSCEGSQIG
jgi:hypothetical protein